MPLISSDFLDVPNFRQIFDLAVAGHLRTFPPAVADVTRTLKRNASSVHKQVRLLEGAGYIELAGEKNRPRTIVLTEKGIAAADLTPREATSSPSFEPSSGFEFEVVTQNARCGPATIAGESVTPFCMAHLFPTWRDGDRVIIAEDCSMIDPHRDEISIYPGDIAHGRSGIAPQNGVNVYVEYGVETGKGMENECNIKQWFFDEQTSTVTLHSLNPDYPSIVRPLKDIGQVAVVLGVRRLLGATK